MMFAQLYLQYEAAYVESGTRQGRELDTEFVPVGARMLVKENGEEGIVR